MTPLSALVGWRIRRIDGPVAGLFCFTLRGSEDRGVLLLATEGPDWALAEDRPRGLHASSFVRLLRKHAENAIVEGVHAGDGLRLETRRGSHEAVITLAADGTLSVHAEGRTIAEQRGRAGGGARPASVEEARTHAPTLVAAIVGGDTESKRRALAKALGRRITRLRRRLTKIDGDLNREAEVGGLRARGSALLAELSRLPADAREVEVTDWGAQPPAKIRIAIGAGRTPKEEADRFFVRARKLERGAEIALERMSLTEKEIEQLAALREQVASADEEGLSGLEGQAARLGVKLAQAGPRKGVAAERRPYRVFRGHGDRVIHVGRSARDNDALTLGSRPWDCWLHARGVPGSHVVVPLRKGESCPPELLIDAAHLAAHYSQMSGEARVEVTHTDRRYVRKPKGFAAGAVRVEREKVIVLRVEADRLSQLLATSPS